MNKREAVSQFLEITGCKNASEANSYLSACDFDLASAVDLYLSRDTGENDADMRGGSDVVMLSDDEDIQCIDATKKKLTNGKNRSDPRPGPSNANSNPRPGPSTRNSDYVRPPIPSTRGTLVEQSFSQQYGSRTSNMVTSAFGQPGPDYRRLAAEQERHLRGVEPEVPNGRSNPRNGSNGCESTRPKSLQSLFRPPVDIQFNGNWESAKTAACNAEKWLLINIQDMQEFACQTLNRDVWSNCGVKELVKTNFVFWQIPSDSSDGERLRNYYRIVAFPAIFIVDPRTGELLTSIQLKRQDPVTFCDSITSFLDQNPDFSSRDRALSTKPEYESNPGNLFYAAAEPECSRSQAIGMDEDSREGRQARKRKPAIATSNGESSKRCRVTFEDMDNVDEMLNTNTRSLSVVDKDDWLKEVSPNGQVCRLRLKLPDGTLHTIEITNESKLKALILFISGLGVSGRDHMFVLSFPRREYSMESAEKSLKDLGFSRNEMVHVELK